MTEAPLIEPSSTPGPAPTLQPPVTPQLTATIAATDTALPTLTFTPTRLVLSEEGANRDKPDDVLEELWVFGGGNGWFGCTEDDPPPPHAQLVSKSAQVSYELLQPAGVLSCGWQAGERVQIRVDYPDGRTAQAEDVALQVADQTFGGVFYQFMPTLDDPPGDYGFYFSGASGEASLTVSFANPVDAQIYWLGDGRLVLNQFAPYEIVRLIIYDEGLNFKAWQEVKVDERGRLEMTTESQGSVTAVGEQSGESEPLPLTPDYYQTSRVYPRWPDECSILRYPCPEGLEQRVVCNTIPMICENIASVPVFDQPGLSAVQIGSLAGGEGVAISGGPVCRDQMSWWKVVFYGDQDQTDGWVSEGSLADGYFLCP